MPANLEAAIYGDITVGSVLAVESTRQQTLLGTLAGVIIALLLYWLAHSYAESAAQRLREGEPLSMTGLWQTMTHEVAILLGAAFPLLALLLAEAAGASLSQANTAAVWTSASAVVLIEGVAAARSHRSGADRVLQIAFGALLGVGIVALRLLLHP